MVLSIHEYSTAQVRPVVDFGWARGQEAVSRVGFQFCSVSVALSHTRPTQSYVAHSVVFLFFITHPAWFILEA